MKFGRNGALAFLDEPRADENLETCSNGISPHSYYILVPLTAMGWSGLFIPDYADILPMTVHGTLAYAVNYALHEAGLNELSNNFFSALAVTLSAGVCSRVTGKTSVSYSVAGL